MALLVCETVTCAIATDGTLWCWGYNELGQLGLNARWRDVLVRTE